MTACPGIQLVPSCTKKGVVFDRKQRPFLFWTIPKRLCGQNDAEWKVEREAEQQKQVPSRVMRKLVCRLRLNEVSQQ